MTRFIMFITSVKFISVIIGAFENGPVVQTVNLISGGSEGACGVTLVTYLEGLGPS